MSQFQERLAASIREGWHTDESGWFEVEPNADELARHSLEVLGEELMHAMHDLAEIHACGSRDFGRGYSLAIKNAQNIIREICSPSPVERPATC